MPCFQRDSGWIGADGNYSIPLSGDTTLWLFSDTFVGKVKDGKRLDACMINNSIALQRGTNAPEFFYGTTADGKPASFIKPQHGSKRDYFWLAHGARTARGLYFFLHRVVTVKPARRLDSSRWMAGSPMSQIPTPRRRNGASRRRRCPLRRSSTKARLIFGGAVLREGEYVYIFGGDSRPEAKKAGMPNGMVAGPRAGGRARRLRAMALSGERRVAGGFRRRSRPSSRTSAASSRCPGCPRGKPTPQSIPKALEGEFSSGSRRAGRPLGRAGASVSLPGDGLAVQGLLLRRQSPPGADQRARTSC